MKRIILLSILAVLLFVGTAQPAATGITYNCAVTITEMPGPGQTFVMYSGLTPATVATDSIGDHYTKWMWIPELTENDCYFNFITNNPNTATEKVDIYVEYSYDRVSSTAFVGTAASGLLSNDQAATRVADTLNVIVGARDFNFKTGMWLRLHFDYQAGSPIGMITTWKLIFRKDPETIGYVAKTASSL